MLQILVTQSCNNACQFCATESPSVANVSFLPRERILSFVSEAFDDYPDTVWDRRIVLTGGEPTLHPDLLDIAYHLKSRYGLEIGLQSNCRKMSDLTFAAALQEAGIDWVLASIYGPNARIHDDITQRPGGFRQTIQGIQNLLEQKVHVEARAVLHRAMVENLLDYVKLGASKLQGIWRLSVVTLDYTGCVPDNLDVVAAELPVVVHEFLAAADLAKSMHTPLRIICCPLCYLPVSYWDLVVPAESVPGHFLSWEKETHDNQKKNFGYRAECVKCLMHGLCPGVASSYLDFFPSTEVWPIEDVDIELRSHIRKRQRQEKLIVSCARTGNWFTTDQSSLIEAVVCDDLATLPSRTKREMLRQEFASPSGFGTHGQLIAEHESPRGSATRVDKLDWDFFLFNVTDACNLRCRYCYSLSNDKTKGTISVLDVLKRLVDLAPYRLAVELHGGEPLIAFPELEEAVSRAEEYASEQNKTISFLVVTNGTLIDHDVAAFFLEHGFSVIVSLDGPQEIHDRYRINAQGKGSYARVIEGIRWLQSLNIPFAVNSVVTTDSVEGILQVFEHHLEHNIHRMKFIPVVPSGDFSLQLARSVFNDAMIEIAKQLGDWPDGLLRPEVLNLSYVVMALLGIRGRYMCMDLPCGAGTRILTVNRDGRIFGCHKLATFPEHSLGDVFQPKLKSALADSGLFKSLLKQKNINAGECQQCEFYGFCGGICYADYWMMQNSKSATISCNFDCMYDVFWYFVNLADQSPDLLSPFLLRPQVGDFV